MSTTMIGRITVSGRLRAALPCGHGTASLDPDAVAAVRRCPACRQSWSVEPSRADETATFTKRSA